MASPDARDSGHPEPRYRMARVLLAVIVLAGGCAAPPREPATFPGVLVYRADLGTVCKPAREPTLCRTRDRVNARLGRAGFKRALATAEPPDRIIVRHDHGDRIERLKAVVEPQGVVGFHLVSRPELQTAQVIEELRSAARNYERELREWAEREPQEGAAARAHPIPPERRALYHPKRRESIVVEAQEAFMVSGERLRRVRVTEDGLGQPGLELSFDAAGARRLGLLTSDNVGRRLAIALDGQALLVVDLYGQLGADNRLTGIFREGELEDLATVLEAGALPVPLELVSEDSR